MVFFNKSRDKQSALLDAFGRCDKRRKYHLYLASCYFTERSARVLINTIREQFHIINVEIWLDRKTALAEGPGKLDNFARKQHVEIFVANTTRLFHTKGYCLVSWDEHNDVVDGCVAIGSANLTGAGITSANGNIESILASYDLNDIQAFYESKENGQWISPKECEEFDKEDDNFIFALLNEGQFCHKWSDSLSQYLAIKYDLNEEGRNRTKGDPLFQETGFVIAAASISKQYFDFTIPHPVERNLIKKYGIETFLGHWLPYAVLPDMVGDSEFQRFREKLLTALSKKMPDICEAINRDYQQLERSGLIDGNKAPAERFREKIIELEENNDKLYRIWSKREFFPLPYDISNRERIRDTFISLTDTIDKQKSWNKSMYAVNRARQELSLAPLRQLQTES